MKGTLKMNITSKQWFQIVSGINGTLITSAALLQTLFGQDLTIKIVAVLGIFGIILNSVGAALSGQGSLMKDVAAIQGDDGKPAVRINVNANAPAALASAAIDPAQPNIGAATPAARQSLLETVKGA